MEKQILLLNSNYEPLSICNPRRVIRMMLLDKVSIIERDGGVCRTSSSEFKLPSVLRLNYYVKLRRRDIPLTKRNVMRRDGQVCQYCGKEDSSLMTIDHILPKSLGGDDTWENMVCACLDCNSRKGDRTVVQAEMMLRRRPRRPNFFTFKLSMIKRIPESWKIYLFLN